VGVRLSLAAALAAALLTSAVSAGSPAPADQQLAWVIAALNGAKAPPTAELRRHFAPSFLKAVPPDQLIEQLAPPFQRLLTGSLATA